MTREPARPPVLLALRQNSSVGLAASFEIETMALPATAARSAACCPSSRPA